MFRLALLALAVAVSTASVADVRAVEMTRGTIAKKAKGAPASVNEDENTDGDAAGNAGNAATPGGTIETSAHPLTIGGPGSAATGGRIGDSIPSSERIGSAVTPTYGGPPQLDPNGPQGPKLDIDDLDFFDRAGNAFEGFGQVTTSIVTLASGLSALTAENGSFLGKIFGAAKVLSGGLGLAYGGNNLLSALTGKYFLPDSLQKWGRIASVVNHGVAMMEVTKLAFSKLGDAWDKITGNDDEDDETKGQGKPKKGDVGPGGGTLTPASAGAPNVVVVVAGGVNDIYRFNCADGGSCFLPSSSGAVGAMRHAPITMSSPQEAYLSACRARYAAGSAPAWWDQAVCKNSAAARALDVNVAAQLGAQDGTAALQKGDAYWAACRSQAPDADLDGSFYAKACGELWTVDHVSGATVPLWAVANDWRQAQQWGLERGAAARR